MPTLKECFRFPLSSAEARADLMTGGSVLFIPLIGWILNLGHRLNVVHRMSKDEANPFHGFKPWNATFMRGLKAATAITCYLSPSIVCALLARQFHIFELWYATALLFGLAIYSLPGGMTYNAVYDDLRYLYRPDMAFQRAMEGGRKYLKAWGIALVAVTLSFLGLLVLVVGFLYTSVWAWTVVGFAFSHALNLKHEARA
jgi:hypothetical protein